jgi:protein-tyrosine phosphatase
MKMNILFVCTGNISRSFLAEMLFREEIAQHCLDGVSVKSAGVLVYPGNPPDANMVAFLEEKGIAVGDHGSRQLAKVEVDWADLILVMQREHADMIKGEWPEAGKKVALLGRYLTAAGMEEDIGDPYGRSAYHYRVVQSQIALAVKSLADRLSAGQI